MDADLRLMVSVHPGDVRVGVVAVWIQELRRRREHETIA